MRTYIPHNAVCFLTMSVEDGLILTANPLIGLIIKSAIARACSHGPITICHYLVNATHIHMLICITDPQHLDDFTERFKCESSHYLNRLFGRRKKTIWCSGNDKPVILDPDKAAEKIIYLYANPAKDHLVDNIAEYPNLNSWNIFRSGEKTCSIPTKLISRPDPTTLPQRKLRHEDYQALADGLAAGKEDISILVQPDEWLTFFGITAPEEIELYRRRIIEGVSEAEALIRESLLKQKKRPLGVHALRNTRPGTPYAPQRMGIKTFCLASCSKMRREFIRSAKAVIKFAEAVYEKWKIGDYSVPYPLGLYPPARPRVAYPLDIHEI